MRPLFSAWRSFACALSGIRRAWRTQRNLRIQSAIALAVAAVGAWLELPARDWAVLALTIGAVLAAELVNTAIEAVVDLASPEVHPLARTAKDTAAAAVLVLAMASVVVGLLILGPPLWERIAGA